MGDIMIVDYIMIGKRLKDFRVAARLTQEKVAEAADITTVYLSRIENGKVTPTLETLAMICAAISADLGAVISGCQCSNKNYGNDIVVELFSACSPEVKPVALKILKELSSIHCVGMNGLGK